MVYEPREDTYLLLNVIKKEVKKGEDFLEIGCGSGIISIEAAKLGAKVTAVDINNEAIEYTKKEAEKSGIKITAKESDLFENVKGKFDMIVFNFPYLPEKIEKDNMEWAAGENLEIIERFANQVKNFLKKNGKIFFVISSLTNPGKVFDIFKKNELKTEIIAEKPLFFEKLYVIKTIL